jgi:drug/metabolite transporter (DMT)-like permease
MYTYAANVWDFPRSRAIFCRPAPNLRPTVRKGYLYHSYQGNAIFSPYTTLNITQTRMYKTREAMAAVYDRRFWVAAFVLALANAGTIGLLNSGLQHTTATRSAFLSQSSVAMTPLLQLAMGDHIRKSMWAAVALCLVSLRVLLASCCCVARGPEGRGNDANTTNHCA